MTQPHYIDRDDLLERLRALDFAGHYDEARFRFIADDILALTPAPTEADTSLQKVQTTPPDMEAVAWREKLAVVEAIQAFYLIDWNRLDAEELADAILQALAVIPTEGLGSFSQAKIPTEQADRAVLTPEQIEEDRLRDEDEAIMPGGFN